jgi:hypothetical protein
MNVLHRQKNFLIQSAARPHAAGKILSEFRILPLPRSRT